MKNIIKSLLVIAATLVIATGYTTAYFTSTDSVVGNTISTGRLHVTVNEGRNKPVSVSNMKPGDSISGWFDAYNDGTLEAEYWFYIDNVTGDSALKDALNISLRDGGYTGACDGPAIWSGKLKDLEAIANAQKISDNNVHAGSTAGGDNIRAGWTQRVCQTIDLPTTAGNEVQDKTLTFDEVVYATQDIDPDVWPLP